MAVEATSVRFVQPSCLRRFATWCLTPWTEMPSSSAIVLLVAPVDDELQDGVLTRALSLTGTGLGEPRSWPRRNSAIVAGIGNSRSSSRASRERSIGDREVVF